MSDAWRDETQLAGADAFAGASPERMTARHDEPAAPEGVAPTLAASPLGEPDAHAREDADEEVVVDEDDDRTLTPEEHDFAGATMPAPYGSDPDDDVDSDATMTPEGYAPSPEPEPVPREPERAAPEQSGALHEPTER